MIKAAEDVPMPLQVPLFNLYFKKGEFLTEWTKAITIPWHKKDSFSDINNCGEIALLNVHGKIFTKCLNQRLTYWYNQETLFCEKQAGFRAKNSTIDQWFVLMYHIKIVNFYVPWDKGLKYEINVLSRTQNAIVCFWSFLPETFDLIAKRIWTWVHDSLKILGGFWSDKD